tara:strand:- start:316 stop:759 length:444 start_codon:yes stop_codon:yes gene_type:complete
MHAEHREHYNGFSTETSCNDARYFATAATDQQLNDAKAERYLGVEGIEERVCRVAVQRVVEIWPICPTCLAGCSPPRSTATPLMPDHIVDASAAPVGLSLHRPGYHPSKLGSLNDAFRRWKQPCPPASQGVGTTAVCVCHSSLKSEE